MSNYTQNVFFTPKDALPSGNPSKVALGAEIDGELGEIETAIASKEDLANKNQPSGYAGLDAGSLLDPTVIPQATDIAFGGSELATATEVNTGTDAERIVTPATVKGLLQGGATYAVTFDNLTVSTTAALPAGTTLGGSTPLTASSDVDHDLTTGFVADEHVDHSTVSISAGVGLSGGGTIAANRTIDLDITGLTDFGASTFVVADEFLVNDGGTMKRVNWNDAHIIVNDVAGTTDTLAEADMNTYIRYTGGSPVADTLNTGVGKIGNWVIIEQGGAGAVTISGTATLNSALGTSPNGQYAVIMLVQVAANTWTVFGNGA